MSSFNELKVLTLCEGFAVGGHTVDVDMTVRFFLMQDVGGRGMMVTVSDGS